MRTVGIDNIELAAQAVDEGKLVIVPTARWYMICGSAIDADACGRIYIGKRRPKGKSLLLALSGLQRARQLFDLSDDALTLINAFWPGDLALRLRWATPELGKGHQAVGDEVALVGCPSGPLGELARGASVPVACTSANISGKPGSYGLGPSITPDEVREFVRDAGMEIAVLVDGGICPQFQHMTVVDCAQPENPAEITRHGTVHARAISAALRREVSAGAN